MSATLITSDWNLIKRTDSPIKDWVTDDFQEIFQKMISEYLFFIFSSFLLWKPTHFLIELVIYVKIFDTRQVSEIGHLVQISVTWLKNNSNIKKKNLYLHKTFETKTQKTLQFFLHFGINIFCRLACRWQRFVSILTSDIKGIVK